MGRAITLIKWDLEWLSVAVVARRSQSSFVCFKGDVNSLCDSRKVFSPLVDFKGDVFISCVIQERCFLIPLLSYLWLYLWFILVWVNLVFKRLTTGCLVFWSEPVMQFSLPYSLYFIVFLKNKGNIFNWTLRKKFKSTIFIKNLIHSPLSFCPNTNHFVAHF